MSKIFKKQNTKLLYKDNFPELSSKSVNNYYKNFEGMKYVEKDDEYNHTRTYIIVINTDVYFKLPIIIRNYLRSYTKEMIENSIEYNNFNIFKKLLIKLQYGDKEFYKSLKAHKHNIRKFKLNYEDFVIIINNYYDLIKQQEDNNYFAPDYIFKIKQHLDKIIVYFDKLRKRDKNVFQY